MATTEPTVARIVSPAGVTVSGLAPEEAAAVVVCPAGAGVVAAAAELAADAAAASRFPNTALQTVEFALMCPDPAAPSHSWFAKWLGGTRAQWQ